MNTYYAIIYTSISPLSHERINLGLLLFEEGGNSIVKFSPEKLSLIKQVLPDDSFKLLKVQLKAFENQMATKNDFSLDFKQFDSIFIQYLSNYTNNLISVTSPKKIDLEVTEGVFDKLYEMYIYKSESTKTLIENTFSSLLEAKRDFIPKVKERVNVDYQLKASQFDFMVFNLQVDMIGKNDVPVLTQFVDFQFGAEAIKHRINDYVSIIKPFEINRGKVGKFFIVGQEPDKGFKKQHIIWENLLDSPLVSKSIVQIVPPNELEEIHDYLEQHDVRPFDFIEN